MSLTDSFIENAKTFDKPRRLADSGGLYLLLNPDGSRWWRFDYRYAGKRKTLSMGVYPDTRLNVARDKRDAARKLLAAGVDPGEHRKAAKVTGEEDTANNFGVLVQEQLTKLVSIRPRPLGALGIDDLEERVYRFLLAHRMATAEDVSHLLSLSFRKAQQVLNSIEAKGLATHSLERPQRYIAASPKLAVEALISQRHTDIDMASSVIPELIDQASNPADIQQREQNVELISSRAALVQTLEQMLQTVRSEIFAFQRPPMYSIHQKIPQGVRVRTISDAGYLGLPGALDALQIVTKMGEEARVFPTLPVKMAVFDRRIGLIPLRAEDPNGPILLVRECSLIDALCALFDLTWEQSTPVVFTRAGKLQPGKQDPRLSDAAEQVIPLLAAGLNDKAIAHEAGMSSATLNRRVAELMKSFGTRTRFQLGWRAALEAFPERMAADAQRKRSARSR